MLADSKFQKGCVCVFVCMLMWEGWERKEVVIHKTRKEFICTSEGGEGYEKKETGRTNPRQSH